MRKWIFSVLIFSLVCADQLVKWWTVEHIALDSSQAFIPGLLNLAYLRNYGAAYSILQNQQWFFILVTIVVLIGAVWYFFKNREGNLWLLTALSLVIAGGLGNFIDRLRLGYVVDMFHLDFIDFPVFNLADICVTFGVGLLFIYIMKEEVNGTHH